MDPVTLGVIGAAVVEGGTAATGAAAVGIGSTALAAVTGAIGSVLGGAGQKSLFKYQAGVADVNRRISLQNADYSRKVGEAQTLESGMRTRAQVGETLSRQGGSGLDVNRGSAALVRSSEEEIGKYDQAVIRANAAKQAYGYEVEAMKETAQGQVYRTAGDQAMVAGEIGGFSSLLSGAGAVSSRWMQASQMGIPGFA